MFFHSKSSQAHVENKLKDKSYDEGFIFQQEEMNPPSAKKGKVSIILPPI
jgi:hypothetical protein